MARRYGFEPDLVIDGQGRLISLTDPLAQRSTALRYALWQTVFKPDHPNHFLLNVVVGACIDGCQRSDLRS